MGKQVREEGDGAVSIRQKEIKLGTEKGRIKGLGYSCQPRKLPPLSRPSSPDPYLIFQDPVLLVCHRDGEPIVPMQLRQEFTTHDGKRIENL